MLTLIEYRPSHKNSVLQTCPRISTMADVQNAGDAKSDTSSDQVSIFNVRIFFPIVNVSIFDNHVCSRVTMTTALLE